jgi:hypothetical protein
VSQKKLTPQPTGTALQSHRLLLNQLLNLLVKWLEMSVEKLQMCQMGLDQKAMMVAHSPRRPNLPSSAA